MSLLNLLVPGKRYYLFVDGERIEGVLVRADGVAVVLDVGSDLVAVPAASVHAVLEPYERRKAA